MTVTKVPPANVPFFGEILVIAGSVVYVNWSAADVADVPIGVVMVISTVPVDPAGEIAVIWVSEFIVKPAAGIDPKFTAVELVKPKPVIITEVPPLSGP